MEQYFATMFEDVRHERSLILLLSLTDQDMLNKANLLMMKSSLLKISL